MDGICEGFEVGCVDGTTEGNADTLGIIEDTKDGIVVGFWEELGDPDELGLSDGTVEMLGCSDGLAEGFEVGIVEELGYSDGIPVGLKRSANCKARNELILP